MSEPNKEQSTQDKKRRYFIKALITPFIMCNRHFLQFFIWGMFVIVAGQLGTIINLIQRVIFDDWQVYQSLCADSVSGSFYTYSLVLISAVLAPIFSKFIDDEEYSHRKIGTCLTTILIFAMVFCAVFFAASANNELFDRFSTIPEKDVSIDWWQLIFFLLAIILACYSFGYSKLSEHEPEMKLYDNYLNQQNRQVKTITTMSSNQTDDGYGNRL